MTCLEFKLERDSGKENPTKLSLTQTTLMHFQVLTIITAPFRCFRELDGYKTACGWRN
jgi:hypothetical protein